MNGSWEITLPSGAVFPDWSCVSSDIARATLEAVFEIERCEQRWAGLNGDGELVRRAVLDGYARTGHASSIAALGDKIGCDAERLHGLLLELAERDIVILDEQSAIAGAYPFVEQDRGYRLRISGVEINAMCAIDALGAGVMCGADAVIDSSCTQCGEAIHIETRDYGASLGVVTPSDAVVRVGIEYSGNCSANSLCRVMMYFCSDAHLEVWQAANPGEGHRLSMDEALQVGGAMFSPMLKGNSCHE